MSETADRVPTWIGRVVDTAELSTQETSAGEARQSTDQVEADPTPQDPEAPRLRSGSAGSDDSDHGLAPYQPERAGSRRLAAALFGAGAVVVLGLAALALNSQSGESSVSGDVEASTAPEDNVNGDSGQTTQLGEGDSLDVSGQLTEDTTGAASSETDTADDSTDPSTSTDSTTAQLSPAASMDLYRTEAAARSRDAYGVFASGQLHILGRWADQSAAEALGDRASILVGSQNVLYDIELDADANDKAVDGASPVLFIDQPLVFADDAAALDSSSAFLLETAGALMAVYPDARLTLIVPGLESSSGDSAATSEGQKIDSLVATLENVGVPPGRISVEPSAATQDGSIPPFAMLSGGIFVP